MQLSKILKNISETSGTPLGHHLSTSYILEGTVQRPKERWLQRRRALPLQPREESWAAWCDGHARSLRIRDGELPGPQYPENAAGSLRLRNPVAEWDTHGPPARLKSCVPPSILESRDRGLGQNSGPRRAGTVSLFLVLKRRGCRGQQPPALRVPRRGGCGSCPVLNRMRPGPRGLDPSRLHTAEPRQSFWEHWLQSAGRVGSSGLQGRHGSAETRLLPGGSWPWLPWTRPV